MKIVFQIFLVSVVTISFTSTSTISTEATETQAQVENDSQVGAITFSSGPGPKEVKATMVPSPSDEGLPSLSVKSSDDKVIANDEGSVKLNVTETKPNVENDSQGCWIAVPRDPVSIEVEATTVETEDEYYGTTTAKPTTPRPRSREFDDVITNDNGCAKLTSMNIQNDSLAYALWRHPLVEPLIKVTVFNYTNWQQVKSGKDNKLRVEEIGPLIYKQELERVNISFQDEHVSFKNRKYFKHVPSQSKDYRSDKVIVPNVPLAGLISKAMSFTVLVQLAVHQAITILNHPDPFVGLKADEFLWGYEDDIMEVSRSLDSGINREQTFGLLKNGSTSEQFRLNTGESDLNKMNLIEMINERSTLDYWNGHECNRIDASDGFTFPPSMVDKTQTLYVFYPNLCRRLPFVFQEEIENNGMTLYRYRMPRDVFEDPAHNPANSCYCEDGETCPPRGVLNITVCAQIHESLASFPHFFLGDPKLHTDVLGLHPDPELHDSYLDIHPTLGFAIQGRIAFQLNTRIRKNSVFKSFDFLPDGLILPVAWVEMIETITKSVNVPAQGLALAENLQLKVYCQMRIGCHIEWNNFCNCKK